MGSCASKFKLSNEAAPSAPDKNEVVHDVTETKLVSPILEKPNVQQPELEGSESKDTNITEDTGRQSLSFLLLENQGKVAVAEKSPEKAVPESEGVENAISEQTRAASGTESEDSLPVVVSEVGSTVVDEESSGKKVELPGEADAEGKTTEAQKVGLPFATETEKAQTESPKPEITEGGPVRFLNPSNSKTGETRAEPCAAAEDPLPVSGISLTGRPKSCPIEADTVSKPEIGAPISTSENTPSLHKGFLGTGVPVIEEVKSEPFAVEVPCESTFSSDKGADHPSAGAGTEAPGAAVRGEPDGEISSEKKEALPEAVVVTEIEEPTALAAAAAAATPEPAEAKSSETEGKSLESEHFTESRVSKGEATQIPNLGTEIPEGKLSGTAAEKAQTDKTTETETGQGSETISGVRGDPLPRTEVDVETGQVKGERGVGAEEYPGSHC